MADLETEVQLIKRDIEDIKSIHGRLDVAIDKLTDVSNCINRMLAVHEEKLSRQEDSSVELEKQIESRRSELLTKIDDLHSRVTTNTKEIMVSAAAQHAEQNKEIQKIREELSNRVGVLERWRWLIIGGSIIVGFVLQKYMVIGG
jgi:chromosome segregation ATPase